MLIYRYKQEQQTTQQPNKRKEDYYDSERKEINYLQTQ